MPFPLLCSSEGTAAVLKSATATAARRGEELVTEECSDTGMDDWLEEQDVATRWCWEGRVHDCAKDLYNIYKGISFQMTLPSSKSIYC